MHLHYNMTYMVTANYKYTCPGGDEIQHVGRPFLGHTLYILILSELCLWLKKNILKGNRERHLKFFFTSQVNQTAVFIYPRELGHMNIFDAERFFTVNNVKITFFFLK